MARTLIAEIVTPERIVFREEASMVVAPTISGEIGVLPLHAPLVSALQPGEVRVKFADKEDRTEVFAISGGYVQVHEDKVIILADDAVAAGKIDVEHARHSAELAKQRLAEIKESEKSGDLEACRRDLQFCEIQLKVAEKTR